MIWRALIIAAASLLSSASHADEPLFFERLFGHHGDAPHKLLSVAKQYDGSRKFTAMAGPWCRDAINVWAREAGIHLRNNSRRAIDALSLGPHVSNPRPGDLVVMRHHVTVFAGWGGRGVLGLGGNQGHRVTTSSYSRSRVLAFVRI